MDVETALLQAIHDSPTDDTNWQVLADWLEEQDDARGELLRLTLALRANPIGPAAEKQEARIQELLASGVRPCAPTRTNSLGMTFALIRPGAFFMGSPENEAERQANEGPQHEVEITKAFYLGIFPVTQEQYRKVMGKSPSYFSKRGGGKTQVKGQDTGNFPVEQVSWEDAVAFCKKLSKLSEEKRENHLYTLPTEAQWEYACRGGASSKNTPPFHFGAALSSTQANFDGNYPYGGAAEGPYLKRTCPVGSYQPNAFGLYDMHGNVWEWCHDWFDESSYNQSPRQNPQGPQTGGGRVLRGGSWDDHASICRAACRLSLEPGNRFNDIGFRVLLPA